MILSVIPGRGTQTAWYTPRNFAHNPCYRHIQRQSLLGTRHSWYRMYVDKGVHFHHNVHSFYTLELPRRWKNFINNQLVCRKLRSYSPSPVVSPSSGFLSLTFLHFLQVTKAKKQMSTVNDQNNFISRGHKFNWDQTIEITYL